MKPKISGRECGRIHVRITHKGQNIFSIGREKVSIEKIRSLARELGIYPENPFTTMMQLEA